MIGFFLRRAQQLLPGIVRARHQRLPLIKRLRTDFTGVVDAHQPGGVITLART